MAKGLHIILDLYGVNRELIQFVDTVKEILEKLVDEAKLNKVQSFYNQFEPHGVSGVIVLAESHVSVHTWPEDNFVALDIFVCSDFGKAFDFVDRAIKVFKPKTTKKSILFRGDD